MAIMTRFSAARTSAVDGASERIEMRIVGNVAPACVVYKHGTGKPSTLKQVRKRRRRRSVTNRCKHALLHFATQPHTHTQKQKMLAVAAGLDGRRLEPLFGSNPGPKNFWDERGRRWRRRWQHTPPTVRSANEGCHIQKKTVEKAHF